MSKRLTVSLLATALLCSGSLQMSAAQSLPSEWTPEQRQLLQDTLSVNELKRDTERIANEQQELAKQRDRLNEEIKDLETRIAENQERTGTVVRTQYMQQQRPFLLSLLNARSFGELSRVYMYYRLAISHDQQILAGFQKDTDELQNRRNLLAKNSERLAQVKSGIEQQQQRLASLQQDIDEGLLSSDDPQSLTRLADELNVYWNNVGLYEVDEYFAELAAASNELPNYLQESGKMKVSGFGTKYTIELTDQELNEFLRSRNPDFKDFAFTFENGLVVAEGRRDRLTLRIEGRYTLENEPQNAVLFHVDRLVFNGLELPATTTTELEQKYDLGFYPGQVAPVKVNEVNMEQGHLTIALQLVL
ncbi:hypothetical protein [Saccharibacillus sp. JS10]|uniref:hypothetical protein n=1 Tax=Saccharibacillus sp. JS10 TaxID=2950552 RepID=UPI00210D16C4|nr:hypothetical protein [Saccharibacillus sp. JS10]MCQ4086121.1 hypothetical protein [Saccharibacillus sp. JS10]